MINDKTIPVQDFPGLVRDKISHAVINSNTTAYKEYIETAKQLRKRQQMLDNMINEVSSLKNDMQEIKTTLQLLLQQNKP